MPPIQIETAMGHCYNCPNGNIRRDWDRSFDDYQRECSPGADLSPSNRPMSIRFGGDQGNTGGDLVMGIKLNIPAPADGLVHISLEVNDEGCPYAFAFSNDGRSWYTDPNYASRPGTLKTTSYVENLSRGMRVARLG